MFFLSYSQFSEAPIVLPGGTPRGRVFHFETHCPGEFTAVQIVSKVSTIFGSSFFFLSHSFL